MAPGASNLETHSTIPETPWAEEAQALLAALAVAPEIGLDSEEAQLRRRRFGPNALAEAPKRSAWSILLAQFRSLIVLLLAAAAAASLAQGDWLEGGAIAVVLAVNAAIGFFTELSGVRSMEALKSLVRRTARVRRDGREQEVATEDLVPGDVVLLREGDLVPADLALLHASRLLADESTFTGESVPVEKRPGRVDADSSLMERTNFLLGGTSITRGEATGLTVATGMRSELGKIAALAGGAGDTEGATHLEHELNALGRRLLWITLVLAGAIALVGVLEGKRVFRMLETAVALAVACVPEGLPIVATIALARGMLRMARRNAVVNRLSAVETLGATTVICTDKTGTLTENRMTVKTFSVPDGDFDAAGHGRKGAAPQVLALLKVGVLCNDASLHETGAGTTTSGDPIEAALLVAGKEAGVRRQTLLEKGPEAREEPFDPETRMMATYHGREGDYHVAVKGAPEAVLEASAAVAGGGGVATMTDALRKEWEARSEALARDGLRVLAFAEKTEEGLDAAPYAGLTFLGLAGLADPPREEVKAPLESCRRAGISVVMVTGDSPATAQAIAAALGLRGAETPGGAILGRELDRLEAISEAERASLLEARVFARVTPAEKLALIAAYQDRGEIVAMTGDGVNDAPALRQADIGVAMGKRGTQVAREAADMVLRDDAFATIVAAIREGRVLFGNLRKFSFYLLSCNTSEVLIVGLAVIAGMPLPLLPLQLLFLNLVTDVFPALALGVGEGDARVMDHKPRPPRESVLDKPQWVAIAGYGALLTVAVLGALAISLHVLHDNAARAVTVSFLTLSFGQLFHIFNVRGAGTTALRNDIVSNPYVWGALALCGGLLAAAVAVPGLRRVLQIDVPSVRDWGLILAAGIMPLGVGQMLKSLRVALLGDGDTGC